MRILYFYLLRYCDPSYITHTKLIYENTEDLNDFAIGMTRHAIQTYLQFAAPMDFLNPSTKTGHNMYNYTMYLTLIDSLDTLYLMELPEYDLAKEAMKDAHFHYNQSISFFEMNIRIVGGLLGIYTLTTDQLYLTKAQLFVDDILDTLNHSVIPYTFLNLVEKRGHYPKWTKRKAILSEFTTFQLEYFQLSKLTNNPKYRYYAEGIYDIIFGVPLKLKGLYPSFFNPINLTFVNSHLSVGAFGDSCYEYFLKYAILTKNKFYKMKFDESMFVVIQYFKSHGKLIQSHIEDKFDHLTCFLGGILALSAFHFAEDQVATLHLEFAVKFTDYCWAHYNSQPTGLGPDISDNDFVAEDPWFNLRPELAESVFYLYRITGEKKYLKINFKIMQRIQLFCYSDTGYMSVNVIDGKKRDPQDSWFLSETLKYLYLTFNDKLSLDEYVFTTEGHPIRQ